MKALILTAALFLANIVQAEERSTTVLISIDGFAHHYLKDFKPKNLLKIAEEGVLANGMQPVFPSKTFPNHLTLVTGVYPNQHGIEHNNFYHRKIKKEYKLGDGRKDSRWVTAKPIWNYAQEHGLSTAIYFWPESEAKIDGQRPDIYFPYKHNTPNKDRIEQVKQWLLLPEAKRPAFIASYFSTVDSAGHEYGRNSTELKQAIAEIDELIGHLYHFIKETRLPVNLVLVSDHGMAKAGEQNAIDWKPAIKKDDSTLIVNGQTQLVIYEESQQTQKHLVSQLKKLQKSYPGAFEVFSFSDFPKHWNITKKTDATPDIYVTAKPPFTFLKRRGYVSVETHGYDPIDTPEMKALFIANGPDIKQGKKIKSFDNIHVFPLLTELLSLPQSKLVKGDINEIEHVLRKK